MDWWVCVCFLADFWVCVFFFVFGWREISRWVWVCVLTRDRFVFLCLADKRDLLLGLCLCSCWRSVCVLCSWICVLVFVFLSSVFWVYVLCFGFVFLDLCSCYFCSWIWIWVFFQKKISGYVIFFVFNFFYLVKINKLIFFNLNANVVFFNVKKYFLLLI